MASAVIVAVKYRPTFECTARSHMVGSAATLPTVWHEISERPVPEHDAPVDAALHLLDQVEEVRGNVPVEILHVDDLTAKLIDGRCERTDAVLVEGRVGVALALHPCRQAVERSHLTRSMTYPLWLIGAPTFTPGNTIDFRQWSE